MLLAWALALVGLAVGPAAAQDQEPLPCKEAVAEANTHFQFGRFGEASGLLEACLIRDAFSDEAKPPVYELLAQVYEAGGQEAEARMALAALLALNPDYAPDPDFPASFKALVEAVRSEVMPPPLEAPPGPVVEVAPASTHGEAVRNVRLRQDGDQLVVTYDLIGTAKRYTVSLLLSTDGGRSFEALPETVTGDVGAAVPPGTGREITWAALHDYPRGLAGDQYRVQVATQKQRDRGLLYVLGGALIAGGGATVALLLGGGDDGGGNGGAVDIPTPPGRPPGN